MKGSWGRKGSPPIIKMSVNLPVDAVEALKMLAKKRGTSMTEVLRQAIGTEKFIDGVSAAGGKILVEDKKGRIRQLVFR
jgi:Ribbon-helix-helix protein, copG family